MDKSEQRSYPKGHFPVRISVDRKQGDASALHLLGEFIGMAQEKYETATVEPLTGGALHAETTISVPFPDRENIRIDFNIYASETEEKHGKGFYFYMESAF
ncbi:MAG: hypothetical protein IJ693_05530 [Bacteroidaceae bacterium]|nr:hypothetical protein [Bacteroidaceae bacterium]